MWLTIPDLVERMDLSPSRIRRLIDDHTLAVKRVDGILCVPESFLDGVEARPELRGTIIVLNDQGYKGDDVVDWLTSFEESLKASPIDALIAGRKAEVRRVAQALA
ncbi:MAG: DNA-binding protein [Actinomycetales bacterium]|nr:DNA-binding protein [Actinomycetales bacterium]